MSSNNRYTLFSDQCSVGCNVSITLVDGMVIDGTLLEKNDEFQSIRIQDENGEETLFGDDLKRWKILTDNSVCQPAISLTEYSVESVMEVKPLSEESENTATEAQLNETITEVTKKIDTQSEPQNNIEREFNEAKHLAFLAFSGNENLVNVPEPVFMLPQDVIDLKMMSKTDIETVRNKSKSKFDNAIKNHDVSKIREILREIKDIEDRYSSYRIFTLPQLCALLTLKENHESVSNRAVAYEYLKKSLEWNQNDPTSLCGFIAVAMQKSQWKEAGECLMRLLLFKETIDLQDTPLVKALGRCLLNMQDETLPGLMSLRDKLHLQIDYFPYLIFLALAKESQAVAVLAYQKHYAEAKALIPNSIAFQSTAMLYNSEQDNILQPEQCDEPRNDNYSYHSTLTGTVIFYPNRQCGFINNRIRNESFYFSLEDISDNVLRTALMNGITLQIRDIGVAFEDTGYRPWNKTWNIARNVRFVSETEKQRVLGKSEIKLGKKETPFDIKFATLPNDNSPYDKAKRAELLGDLATAEHEFSKAIVLGYKNKSRRGASAVLDLASLYNRQGRADQALQLIEYNQKKYFTETDRDRLDNVRLSILTKAKRFKETVELLDSKISSTRETTGNIKKIANWLQQKAFCYQMLAYAQRDENILKDALTDIIVKLRKLSNYRNYKETSRVMIALEAVQNLPDKLAELLNPQNIEQAEEQIQESVVASFTSDIDEIRLPIIAKHLLDNCQFENVEQRVKEMLLSDSVAINDENIRREIMRLQGQLETRGKRPLAKATIRQSIAAIYWRCRSICKEDEIENNIYLSMCFLGENQVYDKDREMARIYLSTALSIPADYQISFAFAMLLVTYLTTLPDTDKLISKQGSEQFLEYAINLLDQDKDACQAFTRDFPFFANKFYEKCKKFLNEVHKKQRKNLALNNIDLLRKEEQKRYQNEETSLKTLEMATYPTVNLVAERFAILRQIANQFVFQIDRQRLDRLAEIAELLPQIESQKEYLVIERQILEAENAVKNLDDEIQQKPSSLSLQHIKVLLEKLREKIGELKKKNIEESESQLIVVNPLQNDNYVLEGDRILLHIKVQLQRSTAPIQNLEIKIVSAEEIDYDKEMGMSPEMLRDGDSRSLQIDIIPSQDLLKKEAFDVQLKIGYTPINSPESKETETFTFPVRIGEPGEPINNPYDIAGRNPVSDPQKFVGRNDAINEIVRQMTEEPLGRCYIIYGQMRSGKSSTLKQIQRKLLKPCLPVYTDASAAESEGAKTLNFSLMVRDSLRKALAKELTGNEKDLDLLREFNNLFGNQTLLESPVQSFSTMMDYVSERLQGHGWSNPRIVLLIDEFTYIYDNIRSDKMDGSVMRHWKAMLQSASFSAVLVGQDTMPWFLEQFPNEFGVIEKQRISYLSKEETQQMSDGWILENGKSRYRDTAFDRLFELTGGNPFYTQRFCYTLVEYLNSRKARVITEADIDNTCSLLCRGGDNFNKMESSEFHPLYLPLDKQQFSDQQYIEILRQIAVQTKQRGRASISEIFADRLQQDEINKIIEELVRREILDRISETENIKIHVNLYTEYLYANR
ncbi:MAG: hypothetical protein LBE13_16905 [Bacteroidales bacterium]|jgi:hypothetical protein|nr:hypothetical protein [Bacteroidales bacterium]